MSTPTEIKGDINPALRNFFFFSLKSQKNYKEGEKKIGKIKTVSFIITEQKTVMQAESETQKEETVLSDEEKYKMLKIFSVKKEQVDECKSVFVILNMETKVIYIRKKKKTGEIENITI